MIYTIINRNLIRRKRARNIARKIWEQALVNGSLPTEDDIAVEIESLLFEMERK